MSADETTATVDPNNLPTPILTLEPAAARRPTSIRSLLFSANHILVGGTDQIEVWDVSVHIPKSRVLHQRKGHLLLDATFLSSAKTAWVVDDAGLVRLFKPETDFAADWLTIPEFGRQLRATAMSKHLLAFAGVLGDIEIWDLFKKTQLLTLCHDGDGILYSLAWDRDGNRLASARGDSVRVWNVSEGTIVGQPIRITEWTLALALTDDGQSVAAGDMRGQVYLWDLSTGEPEFQRFHAREATVHDIAFSRCGNLLASAGADGTTMIWDRHTGKLLRTLFNGPSVAGVTFSSDGRKIATVDCNGVVKVWLTHIKKENVD